MNTFPPIPEPELLTKLQPRGGKLRIVLDTDTYNEVDDQFALAYALLSPDRIQTEAIYAAPFLNQRSSSAADGMEKSYAEILHLLELIEGTAAPPVYKGSTTYLLPDAPEESAAALDLIERAMAGPADDPLYVVAIGAITNIVSALLIQPEVIKHIVVVWLGGHGLSWPHTKEFNLAQDLAASQLILDCGVPLILIPCAGVTTHLSTTVPELEAWLAGRGPLGDYLVDIVKGYNEDHFAWSKVLWDVAAVAYLVNADWVPANLVSSPILTERLTWSFDARRHLIRSAGYVHRDPIFRDLFAKLNGPQP